MRFMKWLNTVFRALWISAEELEFKTVCTIKGTVTIRRQSHYDLKKGNWAYVEDVIEVNYVLQLNEVGEAKCVVRPLAPIDEEIVRNTSEFADMYAQVIEPWKQQAITLHTLGHIFADHPERVSFPGAGVVTLPPMKPVTFGTLANDVTLITSQNSEPEPVKTVEHVVGPNGNVYPGRVTKAIAL